MQLGSLKRSLLGHIKCHNYSFAFIYERLLSKGNFYKKYYKFLE